MLLGQGMRVLHLLVRTVMVMVMVKVDGVLWHSPPATPPAVGRSAPAQAPVPVPAPALCVEAVVGAAGAGDAGTSHDGDGDGVGGLGAVAQPLVDGDGEDGRGAVAQPPGVRVGVGSDAASWGTRRGDEVGDGDGVGGGGEPQRAGRAWARGLGAAASETHPAPHTPGAPPTPLGATRAARPRAARDLVDIGVVG